MAKTREAKIAELEVELWNLKYPVGTEVILRMDSGIETVTRTRCPAYVSNSGYVVCFFEGVSGHYLLDRASAVEMEQA